MTTDTPEAVRELIDVIERDLYLHRFERKERIKATLLRYAAALEAPAPAAGWRVKALEWNSHGCAWSALGSYVIESDGQRWWANGPHWLPDKPFPTLDAAKAAAQADYAARLAACLEPAAEARGGLPDAEAVRDAATLLLRHLAMAHGESDAAAGQWIGALSAAGIAAEQVHDVLAVFAAPPEEPAE